MAIGAAHVELYPVVFVPMGSRGNSAVESVLRRRKSKLERKSSQIQGDKGHWTSGGKHVIEYADVVL